MPAGKLIWAMSLLVGTTASVMSMSLSATNLVRAGSAMSNPTVAMIFAASVVLASGRKIAASRISPSPGATTKTTNAAASSAFQWKPVLSMKNR
jgi:hypothetical protein